MVELTEVEKAKKLQEFTAAYGPVKILKEKNWDGRELQYVEFSFKKEACALPIGEVYDAPKPKDLEGYFWIYPASVRKGKALTVTSAAEAIKAKSGREAESPEVAKIRAAVTAAAAAAQPAGRGGAGPGGGMRGGGRRGGGAQGAQGPQGAQGAQGQAGGGGRAGGRRGGMRGGG
jgi:hypothetical protein